MSYSVSSKNYWTPSTASLRASLVAQLPVSYLNTCFLSTYMDKDSYSTGVCAVTADFSPYSDQISHDAGQSHHLHGLCCCLQVRKHPKWSLHTHTAQHYSGSQGAVSLGMLTVSNHERARKSTRYGIELNLSHNTDFN